MINKARITAAIETLQHKLLAACDENIGCWKGYLADSAVSTAVAALAMSLQVEDRPYLDRAIAWLCQNINEDGGWGDTTASPSNLSAVLLARAAIFNSGISSALCKNTLSRSSAWLSENLPGHDSQGIVKAVLDFYGKDLSFSAPILTVSMLSGALGNDQTIWREIPALPFEASLLPARFFNLIRLPVVSYAIPALIAVGIAQTRHSPPGNAALRWLRQHSIKPSLRRLRALVPPGGGFLEAAPLTGFVAFCLGRSGFSQHPVTRKGLDFLRQTMRKNGSWPIDTDLSTWLTSLAVKALAKTHGINAAKKEMFANYFTHCQAKRPNPFTQAEPGGWSWTRLSGGVPDSDDTAGALVALASLNDETADTTVTAGLNWLLNIMNEDGGIPTFCRGWGYLPFDRSCPDISAHALMAFGIWSKRCDNLTRGKLEKAMSRIITYLEHARDKDDSWAPLWFGDQDAPDQRNPVYGTAVVLEALATLPEPDIQHLSRPALQWLLQVRNSDGGFGGAANTPSKIETSAKALSAMAAHHIDAEAMQPTVSYLLNAVEAAGNHPLPAAAIGMYFASLWYDEKLYPLIFTLDALGSYLQTNDCSISGETCDA